MKLLSLTLSVALLSADTMMCLFNPSSHRLVTEAQVSLLLPRRHPLHLVFFPLVFLIPSYLHRRWRFCSINSHYANTVVCILLDIRIQLMLATTTVTVITKKRPVSYFHMWVSLYLPQLKTVWLLSAIMFAYIILLLIIIINYYYYPPG